MGNGNVGPLGQSIQQGIAVAAEHMLEDQMMGALKVPVEAGDNKGAQSRFQNVRDLVGKMTPEHAGKLLDQLNAKSGKDPLAKEIKYKFSDASVEKLKQDLAVKSGRASESQTPKAKTSENAQRSPADKQTRKTEADMAGQIKAADLLESLNQSELEKKMETRADNIFRASDVMHKNPEAIMANLHGLTKEEGEALARVWQKKYGTSLDVHLQNQLKGQRLDDAREMVAGRSKQVDLKDASRKANELMHAFDASPVDKDTLVKNLTFLKPDKLQMIKKMFEERYGQSLESVVREKLSGGEREALLKVINFR